MLALLQSLRLSGRKPRAFKRRGLEASQRDIKGRYSFLSVRLAAGVKLLAKNNNHALLLVSTALPPSFTDSLKPDQIWDLAHYVQTLRVSNTGFFHHPKPVSKTN